MESKDRREGFMQRVTFLGQRREILGDNEKSIVRSTGLDNVKSDEQRSFRSALGDAGTETKGGSVW